MSQRSMDSLSRTIRRTYASDEHSRSWQQKDLSLGKSIHSVLLLQSLRITNRDGLLSLKVSAFTSRSMKVRFGRSIHNRLPTPRAVKHHMRRILECAIAELHWCQFRQICWSVSFWRIHPQTQHESNSGKTAKQREVTATWTALSIISHLKVITLKYYIRTVGESAARKKNGGQFRQFCTSLSFWAIHVRAPHGDNHGRH